MTLDICARIAEQYEDAVMRDHHTAMLVCEVQDVIHLGIKAMRAIRLHHITLRDLMELPHVEFRIADSVDLSDLYRRWLAVTSELLTIVNKFEQMGYDVDRADRIREYYQEASLIQCDVTGLSESFKRLEAGEGLGLDEFFDSLPHQD